MSEYYYRNRRRSGRVIRAYIGPLSDPTVSLLYRKNRLYQTEWKVRCEQCRRERKLASELEPKMKKLEQLTCYISIIEYCLSNAGSDDPADPDGSTM